MSDSEIRAAERAYRASGAPQDGEAWVQAVMRTTGLPSTFLIARVIEMQRGLQALVADPMNPQQTTRSSERLRSATNRPVTPDDMVSFLRGGREWLAQPRLSFDVQQSIMVHDAIEAAEAQLQTDPNAHLPRIRGVPAGSAILCNHANENPGHCPCDPDCYCRQLGHTCSDVNEVYARHDGRDVECRLCSRGAQWQFKQEPRLYVCALHLAECRPSAG